MDNTALLNDFQLSPHFNLREFVCPCCGAVKVYPELVQKLESLRQRIGRPIVLNSGYRCPEHNRQVNGKEHSLHLAGKAADIAVHGLGLQQLLKEVEKENFGGIGVYPNFLHVDIGERRRW